jgi:hypothetical protein
MMPDRAQVYATPFLSAALGPHALIPITTTYGRLPMFDINLFGGVKVIYSIHGRHLPHVRKALEELYPAHFCSKAKAEAAMKSKKHGSPNKRTLRLENGSVVAVEASCPEFWRHTTLFVSIVC